MKISILISVGYVLGTFKFMFAHWATYAALAQAEVEYSIVEIFIWVTAGAWSCMSLFYFSSDFLMKRSKRKRLEKRQKALAEGREPEVKKNFTRTNKFIVWVKMKIGVYALTFLGPLFLSIPLGAIVCAKFVGDKNITFPLMLLSTGLYSTLQCTLIYLSL